MFYTPRHRATDSRIPTHVRMVVHNKWATPSDFTVDDPDYPYPRGYSTGEYKSINDNPHPGYFQYRKQGAVVLGDLSVYSRTRSMTSGRQYEPVSWWNGDYGIDVSGDLVGMVEGLVPVSTLSNDLGRMAEVALAKAYAKVNSSSMMSGENASDIDASVSMFKRPFGNARKLLQKMQKSKERILKKTGSLYKASSDAWLEYRYGWKPIMMDMDTIATGVLTNYQRLDRNRLVARAGQSGSRVNSASFGPLFVSSTGWTVSGMGRTESNCSANAGVIYDTLSRTSSQQLSKMLGVRPRDVPGTLWELVPYSFVVDWFANVGTWLQAVTPDPYVNIIGCWVTTVEETISSIEQSHFTYTAGSPTGSHEVAGTLGTSVVTTKSTTRVANPQLSNLPTLTGLSVSALHSADAMGLLCRPILALLGGFKH